MTTITYNVKRCLRESLPRKFLCLMFGHKTNLATSVPLLPPSLPRKFLCLVFGHKTNLATPVPSLGRHCHLCSAAASLPPSQVPLPNVQNKSCDPCSIPRSPLARHCDTCPGAASVPRCVPPSPLARFCDTCSGAASVPRCVPPSR